MKLLITGGLGFIGSEIARQSIEKGFETIVVDKVTYAGDLERLRGYEKKYSFYKEDITNREGISKILLEVKPDVVVHTAAETHVDRSIKDPAIFIETNVGGTQVVLDAAKEVGVSKFINFSTDEVYGALGEDGQFTENTPLNPHSPYSVSKAAADMLGRAYFHTFNLPVITVRPSNNYGPWQYPEKLVPVMIFKAHMGENLPVYGKGQNVREWLHVKDCAGAVFAVIEKGQPGEVYNIGSGEEKRNIDTVKAILSLMNKPESLIEFVKDRPGHDFRYLLSVEKIKRELGWEPEITFEIGMKNTVEWYLDNLDWMKTKLSDLKSYWEKAYYK